MKRTFTLSALCFSRAASQDNPAVRPVSIAGRRETGLQHIPSNGGLIPIEVDRPFHFERVSADGLTRTPRLSQRDGAKM